MHDTISNCRYEISDNFDIILWNRHTSQTVFMLLIAINRANNVCATVTV